VTAAGATFASSPLTIVPTPASTKTLPDASFTRRLALAKKS